MIIAIGSTNPIKVSAFEEVMKNYVLLQDAKIHPISVSSDVSDQPLSLNETVRGAKNRARNAFNECHGRLFSIGIESGLMEVSESKTGFMEFCVCCVYNGKDYYFGQSCAFELPQAIINLIINEKKELGDACFQAGYTTNPKLGAAEGLISILTNGRINRKEYTKQAIITALIQIEKAELF